MGFVTLKKGTTGIWPSRSHGELHFIFNFYFRAGHDSFYMVNPIQNEKYITGFHMLNVAILEPKVSIFVCHNTILKPITCDFA